MSQLPATLPDAPFAARAVEKTAALLSGLNALTEHHRAACQPYDRMVGTIFGNSPAARLSDVPWLPVQMFKRAELRSVPPEAVVKTLMSSGTSGQVPSRIFLDRETATAQTRALVKISGEFLGRSRLPMVIIDDASFLRDRTMFNARAAGILGFSNLGRDHLYLLDDKLTPDWMAFHAFLEKHGDGPILLFGFTFIVWQSFVEAARRSGIAMRLPVGSILIHGGGWKRLEDRKVAPETFKAALLDTFGIARVHNYYGMVEQVGSIYFECEAGRLHTPAYSDVIIRSDRDLTPLGPGQPGLIQVVSLLPRSYPGHSLLTEDVGTLLGEDDCPCGRMGKYFAVHGRIKNVEMRGCSDTRPVAA